MHARPAACRKGQCRLPVTGVGGPRWKVFVVVGGQHKKGNHRKTRGGGHKCAKSDLRARTTAERADKEGATGQGPALR